MSIPFKQCNERNYRKGREFAINWICLHFTSGNGDTAQITRIISRVRAV